MTTKNHFLPEQQSKRTGDVVSPDFDDESIVIPGVPVVISGPSGVGKGSIISVVVERHQEISVSTSMTSRPPRSSEKDGVHYYFVDRPTFLKRIEDGMLLEWAEVYGELYGTPKAPLIRNLESGRDVIMELDVQGGVSVKKALPDACLIFVLPPSWQEQGQRLRGRGTESEEEVQRRLSVVDEELTYLKHYQYIVINRSVEQAAERVRNIIMAERCRRAHLEPVLRRTGLLPNPDKEIHGDS